MAKQRELASVVSSKIWRTVVVAGAMLATPACGGGKKAPTTPQETAAPAPAADPAPPAADPAADAAKAEADAKSAEEARLLAEKEAADKTAKEEADKKAEEEAAKKKRPRGGGDRPTGRGFVLS